MIFNEELRNTIDAVESHLREFNAPCSAFEDLDLFEKDCMSKHIIDKPNGNKDRCPKCHHKYQDKIGEYTEEEKQMMESDEQAIDDMKFEEQFPDYIKFTKTFSINSDEGLYELEIIPKMMQAHYLSKQKVKEILNEILRTSVNIDEIDNKLTKEFSLEE